MADQCNICLLDKLLLHKEVVQVWDLYSQVCSYNDFICNYETLRYKERGTERGERETREEKRRERGKIGEGERGK